MFVSDAGPRTVSKLAVRLEKFVDVLEATTGAVNVRTSVPSRVYIFEDPEKYREYAAAEMEEQVVGYFRGHPELNVIAMRSTAGEHELAVLFHEYVHYFLHNSIGDFPVWLDEGLAEYYSTFESKGDEAAVGHPIDYHLALLRGSGPLDWDRILVVNRSSREYHEAAAAKFYAQSWFLTHYLMLGARRDSEVMNDLVQRVIQGEDSRDVLYDVLGTDTAGLQKSMARYLVRGTLPYRSWEFSQELEARVRSRAELSPAEVEYYLGELVAYGNNRDRASGMAHLEKARSLDRQLHAATLSLSHLRLAEGDVVDAKLLVEEVLDADSTVAAAHLELGRVFVAQEKRSEARDAFRSAVRLDPHDPRPVLEFADTYQDDQQGIWEALALLTQAQQREPRNIDYFEALTRLTAWQGNIDGAARLLASRSMPRDTRRDLERSMVPAFESRMRAAVSKDDPEAALSVIRTLRPIISAPDVIVWLNETEARIAERVASN
ncbi:MAG: DUF1570 domain-containing protein [Candidatus Eisenbacteria bacterium]